MTDQQAAADTGAADGSDIVQIQPALAANELPSLRNAARAVATFREKQRNPDQSQPESPARQAQEPARQDPAQQSVDETDAALQETEAPGEIEAAEPLVEAPIEPPRSWTKEEKERFATLPRETQEYLASREQERDRATRQSQNEAAEGRKAIEAERAKVETARTQYETALPALLATLQEKQAGEFSDIKTIADVEKLAREDWPRYVLWDASQKNLAHVQQQVQAATARQSQEKQQKLAEFISREGELLKEKVPELADPVKGPKLRETAVARLKEIGFSEAELGALWRGETEISLHDHRLQRLIADGVRFQAAQAATRNSTRPAVPLVQRPGTAQPRGAQAAQVVQNLTQRLDKTGNVKDAVRLLVERRKASAR